MEPSVSDVLNRWLGPQRVATGTMGGAGCSCGGTCDRCGPALGTGHDAGVARALREIQSDAPPDYTSYLRNLSALYRIAEADLAIAIARKAKYRAELRGGASETVVLLRSIDGIDAGTIDIRYLNAEADPARKGELPTWRLDAEVPRDLARELANLAPSWVTVERKTDSGAVKLRMASRRNPPRAWVRRFPTLRFPPHDGYDR